MSSTLPLAFMTYNDQLFQKECEGCHKIFTKYTGIYFHNLWYCSFDCYQLHKQRQQNPMVYDYEESREVVPTKKPWNCQSQQPTAWSRKTCSQGVCRQFLPTRENHGKIPTRDPPRQCSYGCQGVKWKPTVDTVHAYGKSGSCTMQRVLISAQKRSTSHGFGFGQGGDVA